MFIESTHSFIYNYWGCTLHVSTNKIISILGEIPGMILRVHTNNYNVMVTDIYSTTPYQSYICTDIEAIHPTIYENNYTTTQCIKLDCRLSTFWFVLVLVYRRLDMSTFWFDDDLVCRRFGLSTFRFVDVLVVSVPICRRFDQLTYKRVHFNTSKPGFKNDHHFADDKSKWISSMTFIFRNFAIK